MDQAGENCKCENSRNNDTDDSHDNLNTTGIVLTTLFADSVPRASFLCNDAHHIYLPRRRLARPIAKRRAGPLTFFITNAQ
jgi:hypothetical protein